MRERYERELQEARRNHAEMKRKVLDTLLQDSSILCINALPSSYGFGVAGPWQRMHPERTQLMHEAQFGGPSEEPFFPASFRFHLGLERGDDRFSVWNVADGEEAPPVHPDDVSGVIVTGSSAMPSILRERPDAPEAEWMNRIQHVLRDLAVRKVPTLAVCFGHQILAVTHGGQVDWTQDKAGHQLREIGPARMLLTDEGKQDPLFGRVPEEFWTQSSHMQHVTEVPADAVILAHNPVSRAQALRYVEGLQWSIQNHPDITGILIDMIRDIRSPLIEEELEQLSAESKARLGYGSMRELVRRIEEQDTHEARTQLFGAFLDVIGEQLRTK